MSWKKILSENNYLTCNIVRISVFKSNFKITFSLLCRAVASGPLVFGRSVNPISAGGRAHSPHPVLRAPPDFQTLRRPCCGMLKRNSLQIMLCHENVVSCTTLVKAKHCRHSIYIRTVSCCLLCWTGSNWFIGHYGREIYRYLCTRFVPWTDRKESNVPKLKNS